MRLSPSITATSRRGSGTSSVIAPVATASVGARIPPRAKPTASGTPIIQCTRYATATEADRMPPPGDPWAPVVLQALLRLLAAAMQGQPAPLA